MRSAAFGVFFHSAFLSFFLCAGSFGQQTPNPSVRNVGACEILQNPQAFDRQLMRLRGRLYLEFEGHHVDDSECALPPLHTTIWWTYGGDDLPVLGRERRELQAFVLPVQRDAGFDAFERYVHLGRTSARTTHPVTPVRSVRTMTWWLRSPGDFFPENRLHGVKG